MNTHWTDSKTVIRVTLLVIAALWMVWVVYQLRTIILLVILSILFAYLIAPLVAFVRRPRVPGTRRELHPGIAIAIVYLFLFGSSALALSWLVPNLTEQASQFAKDAPHRIEAAQAGGQVLTRFYGRLQGLGLSALVERAITTASAAADSSVRGTASAFVHAATFLPWLVLIPILAFFLLKDAEMFRQAALTLLPWRWRIHAAEFFDRVNVALAAYIRAQLVACLLIGFIVGIGFKVLRVPYAATLGVMAGFAEFVPIVGPFIVAVVSAGVAAMHFPMLALWVLLFLGVLRLAEDYVIYPRLIGHGIHLHPLAIILGVLAGAELGGVVGVLLSVPVLAIVSTAYKFYVEADSREPRSPATLEPARERPSA